MSTLLAIVASEPLKPAHLTPISMSTNPMSRLSEISAGILLLSLFVIVNFDGPLDFWGGMDYALGTGGMLLQCYRDLRPTT